MNKLYYGNGSCTIEGDEIIALQIKYSGAIQITDKTPDNYNIIANSFKMIIFYNGMPSSLNNLFDYKGDLTITSVTGVNKNIDKVQVAIHRVMDYSELLETNAEDLTTNSESLNAGHLHKGKVRKTTVDNKIMKNQQSKGYLYREDGTSYSGLFHIHLETGLCMTGSEHTKGSQDLYILRKKDNKLIKTGTTKKQVSSKTATTRRTSRTTSGGASSGGY